MAIETGLRTLLLSQPEITGIAKDQSVQGVVYRGVFNEHPVEGFFPPFVLISQMSLDPLAHLGATSGLRFDEFDIDAYSRSYPEALALSQAIQDFLFPPDGSGDYTGPAGTDDTIKAVVFEDKRYDEVFEAQGQDIRQHIVSLTIQVQHQPSH